MGDISTWSPVDANNNQSPPNGWPEGQAPSTVNNCARADKGGVRRWYENAQWLDYGFSVTRNTSTQFVVASATSTAVAWYQVGRRVRFTESTSGVVGYGTVASASVSDTTTNVTCVFDSSASLTSSLSSVDVGIITPLNPGTSVGKIVQYKVGISTTDDSTTSTSYQASSLSVSITPTIATNRILVLAFVPNQNAQNAGSPSNRYTALKIRNTTQSTDLVFGNTGRVLVAGSSASATSLGSSFLMGSEIAPDTSSNTYQLQYHANGTTTTSSILGSTLGPPIMIALELVV